MMLQITMVFDNRVMGDSDARGSSRDAERREDDDDTSSSSSDDDDDSSTTSMSSSSSDDSGDGMAAVFLCHHSINHELKCFIVLFRFT